MKKTLVKTIGALALVALSTVSAFAATDTWQGNASALFSGLNWTGINNPPLSGDSLAFGAAGTAGASLTADQTAAISYAGITFNSGASAYTIGGANGITLTGNVTNNGTSLETLNFPIAATAVRTFTTTAGGGDLTLGGIFSGTGGGITTSGGGTVTLSGANTYTGVTTVNGGTLAFSGSGSLGLTGTAAGQLTVNGSGANSIVNIGSSANIKFNNANVLDGDNATAAGAIFQAGTVTGMNQLKLNDVNGGYGYYNLSGGSLTFAELDGGGIDAAGTGVFDMTGGTVTNTTWFILARASGNYPVLLNLTGGTYNFTGGSVNQLRMNWNANAGASAVINVANANFYATNATGGILNMMSSGASGQLGAVNLLSGGLMQVQGVNPANTTGTSHFNFNGGTLKASTANTTFLATALKSVNVYSGGGTIDNNGVNITIPAGLNAPAGDGISSSSISVPSGGSGYIGAPAVTFSGGSGIGATAYAVLNSGVVDHIVVTSPGIGYVDGETVTASFTGGGAATAATAVTGIAVAANTSGGLTFQGSGTTTLSGTNTYSGTTVVSQGVLAVNTNQANGAVTVADGATLSVVATLDSTYWSPSSMTVGISTGGVLQFSLAGTITGVNANTLLTPASLTLHGTTTINVAQCPPVVGSYPLFSGYNGTSPLVLGSQPGGDLGQLTAISGTVYYQVTNTVVDVWTDSSQH